MDQPLRWKLLKSFKTLPTVQHTSGRLFNLMFFLLYPFCVLPIQAQNINVDYLQYHKQCINIENLIIDERYQLALDEYEALFQQYDFIFLKEYKVATQLSIYLGEMEKARHYLEKGILAGWTLKAIKKDQSLAKLRNHDSWKSIQQAYPLLQRKFEAKLDHKLKKQVKKMFSKDQWKAFGALFTFSSKAQDRYAEKKFAPHSEDQMAEVYPILANYGYPGEKMIGNNFWMSTILSHHNSISQAYAKNDTIFESLKPKLLKALKKGELSPFELALMEDWRQATLSGHDRAFYGFLNPPRASELVEVNQRREEIGLRPVQLRNKLVDIQEKTGMIFYLDGGPWVEGKMEVLE